jgi:hypothetical protein
MLANVSSILTDIKLGDQERNRNNLDTLNCYNCYTVECFSWDNCSIPRISHFEVYSV